ncbi:MAG TPA: SdrD B-like domain-containing protein, partial [Nitrosopumilaceae archaeon]|nr:SdrD B-like domain-containing protein [Nitrosopumilaceae archaeon]
MKTNLHFTKFMSLSVLTVLLIFFISYFPADAHSAYAASLGLINGAVFSDTNLNGIKDGGELGISNVQITLTGTFSNGTTITPRNVLSANPSGGYAFNQLSNGNYTLTEADISGWAHTSPKIIGPISISGISVTKNFGNIQFGTITARPFNDANANGVQDAGEALVSGWSFTLTGTLVNGTVISPQNIVSSPSAIFSNLYPGTYTLTETNQAGFAHSTANPVAGIVLSSGGSLSSNFGNVQLGTITARPFNDANANGVQNVGEILVSGWSFTLTGTLVNGTVIAPINISSSPTAAFSNLYPGTYTLTETNQAGFAQLTPNPVSSISLPSGGSLSFNFGNFKLGIITARPFNDSNSNGIQDGGESLVSGWSFNLSGKFSNGTNTPTVNIVSSPTAVFSNIFPGNYTLTEADQAGFIHTTSGTISNIFISGSGNNTSFNFGNKKTALVGNSLINGTVFLDSNLNGILNTGELGKKSWPITLGGTLNNGTVLSPITINSSSTGSFAFNKLSPGTYTLTEADISGWAHTSPKIITGISVGSATVITDNFGNVQPGTITARPFNDMNANGVQEVGDALVSGWSFNLSGKFSNGTNTPTINIVSSPTAVFSNIFPGNYTLTEA